MRADTIRKLRLCPKLPTLSGVALRLVEAARNPDVDLNEIGELVSHDPALAAKILRVANSSLYPRFRQAQNLTQAIQVLGLNTTITMSLGFSLAAGLKAYQSSGIDLETLWRRALISALAARLLGQHCEVALLDELFLAALLQDIGRLALDAAFADESHATTQDSATNHEALVAMERQVSGTDHLEAGAWLMDEWRLPEFFKVALWCSHDQGPRNNLGELTTFVSCVAASGPIADIYLATDTVAATQHAQQVATSCLGLSADDLNAILDRLVASLPETQMLFDATMLSAAEAEGLTEQAHELIISRNLRQLDVLSDEQSRGEDLKEIADQLYDVAHRDALTCVFNRRHFDEALAVVFAEAGGNRQPLSLAYLDLDSFKKVNDKYGHMAGDIVLKRVAEAIQSYLRPSDQLARYGGEEFVMLLPGLDRVVAKTVIERIRLGVEELRIKLADNLEVSVTLSAGLATYGNGEHGKMAPSDLIQAADKALYQAKHQGRNRLVQAPRFSMQTVAQADAKCG